MYSQQANFLSVFSSLRELGKSRRFNCIRFLFIFILKVSYFLLVEFIYTRSFNMCHQSRFSVEFIRVFGSGDYKFNLTVGYVYTISHCIFMSWIIHYFLGTKEDHISEYLYLYLFRSKWIKLVLVEFFFLQMYCCIP